jgi:hypothetical protein
MPLDVSPARMLGELAADLRRDHVTLASACDIGQVRDVLRQAGADGELVTVHPLEAVKEARASVVRR